MHRSMFLTAVLAALAIFGCGKANPPPPGPAPAYQPPANTSATDAQSSGEPVGGQSSSLTSGEEMPAEEEATQEETSQKDKADDAADSDVPATKTSADERSADSATSDDTTTPTTSARSKRSSSKLLRGLGNSIGRALSKAAAGSGDNSRPAPKLEDDPFPKGEPADDKPNE